MVAAVHGPALTRSTAQSHERRLKRARGWQARLAAMRRLAANLADEGVTLVD